MSFAEMAGDLNLAAAFIDELAFDSDDAFEFESNEDEEATDLFVASVTSALLARDERNRVPFYVESVVSHYMDFEFKKLFRLSRSTAATLTAEFATSAHYPEGCRGRPKISAEKTMLIALTYLGTQASMYSIADKFDVSESTVHSAICRILGFLLSIGAREIHWPDHDEGARNKRAFQALYRHQGRGAGLPDVIGAIDGCHIRIVRPTEREEDYYNRKKFHSIILQGICNADMVFTDVFVGYPGRAHDARVLEESFFFENATGKCEGGYILGNAAYPLLPWLLPPYRQCKGNWQPWMEKFNVVHSRQRVVIEGTFGILKARFQRLAYIDVASIEKAVEIVMAACVLHNISMKCADEMQDVEGVESGTDVSPIDPLNAQQMSSLAARIRDTLAQSL
ncbi:hypothetical protein HPB49_013624 [Dermacentor silvarum]|uniref:Uncharacterized protein n=1 Tax=Dermacentor silvarum TaxID=543639 RepID=A0ACB8DDN6_DERSI|nr:hypothetical protein HPB49_013624 [Dermacentor silvarum]